MSDAQRERGQYFTTGNPFQHPAFLSWAKDAKLPKARILEPFAGQNNIINHLVSMKLCHRFHSYDIEPASRDVRTQDTLAAFPTGYEVCVTNPPWLAKNSATVRGLPFPDTGHDDLYKVALEQCLLNCEWVAVLVPESFIRAGLFHSRLQAFVSLTGDLFRDTNHPVGLALFSPSPQLNVNVWSGTTRVGMLSEVERLRPIPLSNGVNIRFNDPDGNIGLIALDNTREASIRFCPVEELEDYTVKQTGRHITKISVEGGEKIHAWNELLSEFRSKTHDILLTCYKGMRKDGKYRRRCDWQLARGIIHHAG